MSYEATEGYSEKAKNLDINSAFRLEFELILDFYRKLVCGLFAQKQLNKLESEIDTATQTARGGYVAVGDDARAPHYFGPEHFFFELAFGKAYRLFTV